MSAPEGRATQQAQSAPEGRATQQAQSAPEGRATQQAQRGRWRRRHRDPGAERRVLIVVENLPPRRDRRVWREAQALRRAGYGVSLVGPRAPGDPPLQVVEGIHIHSYPPPPAADGVLGFVTEYAYSFVMASLLTARVLRREGADAVQVCNPPDIFFPLGVVLRRLGKPFVLDHHDLTPELYLTRFRSPRPALLRALYALERATFATADHVISTNESYRQVALTRGHKPPEAVTVARNGPDLDHMVRTEPQPELKRGRAHLCCWFGNMGPQDGVDLALRAAASLVHDAHRRDTHFAFVGHGDALASARRLASELDLDEWTTFTGWVEDDVAFSYLSTADVGLCPDPHSPLNDVSTMNKTLEYMAFGVPVVAFDLKETRRSAGEAALYATPDDHVEFGALIGRLLDSPALRAELGNAGRTRIETSLAWSHQRDAYVAVYDRLLAAGAAQKEAVDVG